MTRSKNQDVVDHLKQGNVHCHSDNYQAAIRSYTYALKLNPQYTQAYLCRGIAYAESGNYQMAIKDYYKAIALNPKDTRVYQIRGIAYVELGDNQKAIEDYAKAIELNPQDARAFLYKGVAYAKIGNYQMAIKDYAKVIELNPQDARAFCYRGIAYFSLSNYQMAIKDYDKAIELNSQDATTIGFRGIAYAKSGDNQKAIKDYDKAIELNPQDATAFWYRGNIYDELGNYQKAIKEYDTAIELNPQDAIAIGFRGIAYARLDKHQITIRDFNKVLELEPHNAIAFYIRGLAYDKLDNYQKALRDFKKALRLMPHWALSYVKRCVIYLRCGNYQKAGKELTLAKPYLARESQDVQDQARFLFKWIDWLKTRKTKGVSTVQLHLRCLQEQTQQSEQFRAASIATSTQRLVELTQEAKETKETVKEIKEIVDEINNKIAGVLGQFATVFQLAKMNAHLFVSPQQKTEIEQLDRHRKVASGNTPEVKKPKEKTSLSTLTDPQRELVYEAYRRWIEQPPDAREKPKIYGQEGYYIFPEWTTRNPNRDFTTAVSRLKKNCGTMILRGSARGRGGKRKWDVMIDPSEIFTDKNKFLCIEKSHQIRQRYSKISKIKYNESFFKDLIKAYDLDTTNIRTVLILAHCLYEKTGETEHYLNKGFLAKNINLICLRIKGFKTMLEGSQDIKRWQAYSLKETEIWLEKIAKLIKKYIPQSFQTTDKQWSPYTKRIYRNKYNKRTKQLRQEIGREPSDEEIWAWLYAKEGWLKEQTQKVQDMIKINKPQRLQEWHGSEESPSDDDSILDDNR